MPITQSAKKALRRDKRRAVINRRIKTRLKNILRKAREKPTKKNLTLAYVLIDRAVKKKIIQQNKGGRLKSRLMARLMRKS